MSREGFLRKIGERGCPKHMDIVYAFAYHVCGIWGLGVASTNSQLCITDYKYRNTAGKSNFIWSAQQAWIHNYIWRSFISKRRPGNWFFRPCFNESAGVTFLATQFITRVLLRVFSLKHVHLIAFTFQTGWMKSIYSLLGDNHTHT